MTEQKKERERHYCPFCDAEMLEADLPYCQICGVSVFYCPKCRKSLARDNRVCPHCGADIRSAVTEGGE